MVEASEDGDESDEEEDSSPEKAANRNFNISALSGGEEPLEPESEKEKALADLNAIGTKIFSLCGNYLSDVHTLDYNTCRRRDSLAVEQNDLTAAEERKVAMENEILSPNRKKPDSKEKDRYN
jgi:hypothetical protein